MGAFLSRDLLRPHLLYNLLLERRSRLVFSLPQPPCLRHYGHPRGLFRAQWKLNSPIALSTPSSFQDQALLSIQVIGRFGLPKRTLDR
jgi:hypothetical protein